MQIGLYGGSFNPVHLAHLLVARSALEEVPLDRVVFIPAAQSPFKPRAELAPAGVREQLIRIACAGEPRFGLDNQELERGGVSYTIDTVRKYRLSFPEVRLFWLIGADHTELLPKWRGADELAATVEFLVIPRPGEPVSALPQPFRGQVLKGFPLGVSASQIRERIRVGLSIRHLVPPGVDEAIYNNRLYL